MRLGILGDIHGYLPGGNRMCIEYAVELTETVAVEAFLQVGDMCHYRSFAQPVYWIFGNNDWTDVARQVETGERPLENLYHIKTGEVVTLEKAGETIRIAGLNGAFDELYYDLEDGPDRPLESLPFFIRSDVERSMQLRDIDIMLAHDCPAGLGYGREPDYSVRQIRDVLDAVRPRFMFCGHAHYYKATRTDATAVYALNELRHEYYILDTVTEVLEAFPSGSAA